MRLVRILRHDCGRAPHGAATATPGLKRSQAYARVPCAVCMTVRSPRVLAPRDRLASGVELSESLAMAVREAQARLLGRAQVGVDAGCG